jgi:hypothetical protein
MTMTISASNSNTKSSEKSPTIGGCPAVGISGPAQPFPHAQRARQRLNTPLGSGPGCRDAPCPPTLGVGSARESSDKPPLTHVRLAHYPLTHLSVNRVTFIARNQQIR